MGLFGFLGFGFGRFFEDFARYGFRFCVNGNAQRNILFAREVQRFVNFFCDVYKPVFVNFSFDFLHGFSPPSGFLKTEFGKTEFKQVANFAITNSSLVSGTSYIGSLFGPRHHLGL